jgi:hypothetical protein
MIGNWDICGERKKKEKRDKIIDSFSWNEEKRLRIDFLN